MDTTIPTGTHKVGTHEGMGKAQVSYLSNGTGTGIILSVPIDIPSLSHLIISHRLLLKFLFFQSAET